MNLNEFIDLLQKYQKIGHGDSEVCVRMTGCLSSHTGNPVSGLGPGIDWERGKIMISTQDACERYYTQKQREEQKRKSEEIKNRVQARTKTKLDF